MLKQVCGFQIEKLFLDCKIEKNKKYKLKIKEKNKIINEIKDNMMIENYNYDFWRMT